MDVSAEPVKARVTAVFKERCLLRFPDGERSAAVTGRFRFEAESRADFPAVGDWVTAAIESPEFALVRGILPRTTVISRKVAGSTTEEQVLAANVDVMFIVTSFNEDFNPRRLERYLALARQSGARPVIVLNKADLAGPDDDRMEAALAVAGGAPIVRVSAETGEGIAEVSALIRPGETGVLLGSSGVGKSSILNRLLGTEAQATRTIRVSDGKGRHTTTNRQMFSLPNGGLFIDTPGLREIQLWADAGVLSGVYPEIATLAERCRFRDCRHQGEMGCAVARALEIGELATDRWTGYVKLQKELAYLERKRDPEQAANAKRRWKSIHKNLKDVLRRKRGL